MKTPRLLPFALPALATACVLVLGGCIDDKKNAASTDDAGTGGVRVDASDSNDATSPDAVVVQPDAAQITPDAVVTPDAAPAPTCPEEDANAGNSSAEHATTLLLGYNRDDLYLCPETTDWYKLSLTAGAFVVITAQSNPIENDLDLQLLDATGAQLAVSAHDNGDEQIAYTATADGDVYIQVAGGFHDLSTAYSLRVNSACRRDGDCGADQICSVLTGQCEDALPAMCGSDAQEPNNRDDAGFSVDVAGGPVDGVICGADPDWYKVTLADGDDLDALLSFPQGEDLDLIVRALSDGTIVGEAANNANFNPERLHLAHLPGGDYAVGVLFFDTTDGGTREVPYRFDVATTPGGCASDADCTGGNGPICDVAAHTCGPVPDAGNVGIGGQCGTTADCAGDAAFCAPFGPGGADNYCSVGCADDSECAALGDGAYCLRSGGGMNCARACTEDNQCSATRRCNGGHCESRGGCANDADCRADEVCTAFGMGMRCTARPAAPTCGQNLNPDGTVRADDVAAEAFPVQVGTPLEHQLICDGDLDYFRFTLPAASAGDLLHVSISFRQGADLDLYVQDAAGNTVGVSNSGDQIVETTNTRYAAAGDYVAIVTQYATDALADTEYTISVTVEANDGHCTVAGGECAGTDPLRMTCDEASGACIAFDGAGAVPLGSLCDSDSDCGAGAEACWTMEGPAGSLRGANICTHTCQAEADCADVPNSACQSFSQFAVCLPQGPAPVADAAVPPADAAVAPADAALPAADAGIVPAGDAALPPAADAAPVPPSAP